ncbi:TPA: hypothetical protein DEB29_02800, partial [Candidatus Wolfebacteria bacterium]|nr:hypothetical protein [Candidatus Wolfebacteria bacterium]
LSPSTVYRYRIAAVDAALNTSARSNEVSATTSALPVAASGGGSSSGGGGGGGGSSASVTQSQPTTPVLSGTTQQATTTATPVVTVITTGSQQGTTVTAGSGGGQYSQFGAYVTRKHLVYGSRGEDVKKLQEFLRVDGYLKESATGYYGKATQAAIQKFQQEHAIAGPGKDGYGEVGIKTRSVMNQHLNGSVAGVATATDTQELLKKQIALLQQKVIELLKQLAEMQKKSL